MAEFEPHDFEPREEDMGGEAREARSVIDSESVRNAAAATESAVEELQTAATDEATKEAQKIYIENTLKQLVQILKESNLKLNIDVEDLQTFNELFGNVDSNMGESNPTLQEFEKIKDDPEALKEYLKKMQEYQNKVGERLAELKNNEAEKVKSIGKRMWEYLQDAFNKKSQIENGIKESPNSKVKNSEWSWNKFFDYMKWASIVGGLIAGPILLWKFLKGMADEQTGCYQYLSDGSYFILDGDCGSYYNKEPEKCKCLKDAEGQLSYFTSKNKDGSLSEDQLSHCQNEQEEKKDIIKNNPTCKIHGLGGSCYAKNVGGSKNLDSLKPLGCTDDYTVSYGYFKQTPEGVFNNIIDGLGNAIPSYQGIIKIIIYCVIIIVSLIILFFLIKYFISLFTKKQN